MGNACSSEEEQFDKKLYKTLAQESKLAPKKLLLLGAGMAGKSTVFKQARILYGQGFSEVERKAYRSVLHANIIEGIKILVSEAQKTEGDFSEASAGIATDVMKLQLNDNLTPELGQRIEQLWHDSHVQKTFERRSEFGLGDTVGYMLSNAGQMCDPEYVPTEEDIVRARIRTSGIQEMRFKMNKVTFRIVDVGGQRGERKKWIHCFDDVKAVLFVAAISEYDQVVPEDPSKNSLLEAHELFDSVCNLPTFAHTSMILFLNKSDLFAEKFEKKIGDIRAAFEDYDLGFDNLDNTVGWLTEKFISVNRNERKQVYPHVTCATNKHNLTVVFEAVQDIVVRENLENCELY